MQIGQNFSSQALADGLGSLSDRLNSYAIPNIHGILSTNTKDYLAQKLGVQFSDLQFLEMKPMQEFEKGWIGWPKPLDPSQPSYLVVIEHNGTKYEIYTDSLIRNIALKDDWLA